MEGGYIPGNNYFEKPNPKLTGLANGKLNLITEKTKYNGGLVAVNGIGISSSHGHILLRPNPKTKTDLQNDLPKLYILSTRTEDGIKSIIEDVSI